MEMTDFRSEWSLGARIRAARRARGLRTARELADAIVGGTLTEAIIENIEAGRKVVLDISQLLNIAMALRVPLSYLLAPLGEPDRPLDLPNLSQAFEGMTAIEFDSWLASSQDGRYQPESLEERNATSELHALREWSALTREATRLQTMSDLERATHQTADTGSALLRSTEARLVDARRESNRLAAYLKSAGWHVE
jgi:transcriptional regulator with XRE-family HTH domain